MSRDQIKFIKNKYRNWHSLYFEQKNGEFYPKKIDPPKIEFIQYPEPRVIITDWYENPEEWYQLRDLIAPFAEQAFLCYASGYWHASIACCINCCESVLKYEYLRRITRSESKELITGKQFSFGFFTGDNNKNLAKLRVRKRFQTKLNYLNDIRIGLYHFNPKRISKINKKRSKLIESGINAIADQLTIPIIAHDAYEIMQDVLGYFYNNRMEIKYINEGLREWKYQK